MSGFDHEDLPPELGSVADQLRSHRYEASALELDQAKTRIMRRAGGRPVARGGHMRRRSLITALIMVAAIGTGSSAAAAIGGLGSFPFSSFIFPVHSRVVVTATVPSAALTQYPPPPVTCRLGIPFVCNILRNLELRFERRNPGFARLFAAIFGLPYP